jgi:hypothetical protein
MRRIGTQVGGKREAREVLGEEMGAGRQTPCWSVTKCGRGYAQSDPTS